MMPLRRIGVSLLAVVTATAGLVVAAPTAAHASGTFEMETSATISPSWSGQVSSDSNASGSSRVDLWDSGTVSKTFTSSASTGELKIYASGWGCKNNATGKIQPEMQVRVNGTIVGKPQMVRYAVPYGNAVWFNASGAEFRMFGPWGAGTHTVSIEFTNPYANTGTCYRMLSIDKIDYIDGSGYVTRNGDELQLNGNRYRYLGWNAFGMMGCDNGGTAWTNTQLDAYFALHSPGSVTRTWAFYNAASTTDLARILASARKYQQKVMFSLADGPSHCEGDGSYNSWPSGQGGGKTDAWYDGGFRTTYKPHVGTVVDYFKNDPTVFGWEIMNEPGHGATHTYGGGNSGMEAFLDEMADYIDSIDSNHLVISGTMSAQNSYTSDFQDIHDHADIDVATVHEYHYDYTGTNISPEIAYRAADTQAINKPLLVTETGSFAGSSCTDTIFERRDLTHDRMVAYVGIGTTGGITGVEGANVWNALLDATGVNMCSDQRAFDVTNGDPYFYDAADQNNMLPK